MAEIGRRLGRKALAQVACIAKPDTILGWYRRLIAQKFDGSKRRSYPGRPPVEAKLEALIVQIAKENSGWGYDRIVIAPAPKRSQSTSWKEFIQSHMAVLAGIDFFTVEVLSWRGLVTYYVLFFIHLESRRVSLAGITRHPDQAWMQQMARNATGQEGFLEQRRYALHDRDTKFCSVFRETLAAGGIRPIQLPARSPNLNAYAELSEKGEHEPCFGQGVHLITSLRGVYSQQKPAQLRQRLRSTLRRLRVPASGRREGRQSAGESNESCGDRGAASLKRRGAIPPWHVRCSVTPATHRGGHRWS